MKININKIVIAAVSFAILCMLSAAAYMYLEPYKKTRRTLIVDSAVKENSYIAMDRWLESTGHKTRMERSGNAKSVMEADEDVILIFTSAFDFEDSQTLINAIKAGKQVTIFNDKALNNNYYDFLESIRAVIKTQNKLDKTSIVRSNFKKAVDPNAQYHTLNRTVEEIKHKKEAPEIKNAKDSSNSKIEEDDGYNYYNIDNHYFEYIGRGFINIANEYSITNYSIEEKYNAEEAWNFTGALDTDGRGIYIVRSKESENGTLWKKKTEITLWNILAQKGALLPIIIPSIAIIIFGFWIILLPFGKDKKEVEIHGKPIRMRFLAEAHFYKKYNLLNKYLKYLPKDLKVNDNESVTISDLKKLLEKRDNKLQ